MPLTLRPTHLSRNPNANDWSIHEDGVEIGRLYEDLTATRPEIAWFWSGSSSWGRHGTVSGPMDERRRSRRPRRSLRRAWETFRRAEENPDSAT
jgi:hypothetical protein